MFTPLFSHSYFLVGYHKPVLIKMDLKAFCLKIYGKKSAGFGDL